jgi:hypothetical protein
VAVVLIAVVAAVCWLAAGASWAGNSRSASVIVSGTVVNKAHEPLSGVRVDLYYPIVSGQVAKVTPLRVGSAVTDRLGRFVVRAAATSALEKYSSRNRGWLKFDLLAGKLSLALHRGIRRRLVNGLWFGPPTVAGRTDLGVLVLALGQPGVDAVTGGTAVGGGTQSQGWLYGSVVRGPGLDPRSGSGGDGASVPVSGDTVVARGAGGSSSAVSAQDGSFQMRLRKGPFTVSEDICGVSQQVTIESDAATRVMLAIPNSC